jgi:DNA-binding MarR family transcriptional regulator
MRTLAEHPGATQSELTGLMSSDPNTVAALLDRMEKGGLIARRRHEADRRALRVCLTPEGQTKFEAAREIALDLQAEVLEHLKPAQRLSFLKHLEIVAEACHRLADHP